VDWVDAATGVMRAEVSGLVGGMATLDEKGRNLSGIQRDQVKGFLTCVDQIMSLDELEP
jgi:hypothetical protein